MKELKQITIQREFLKHGFRRHNADDPKDTRLYFKSNIGKFLYIHFPEKFGNITIEDCRWFKKGNVHINSYYHVPRNRKELLDMIKDIKDTYSELCHIEFKEK